MTAVIGRLPIHAMDTERELSFLAALEVPVVSGTDEACGKTVQACQRDADPRRQPGLRPCRAS